jgi:hypothetical protein
MIAILSAAPAENIEGLIGIIWIGSVCSLIFSRSLIVFAWFLVMSFIAAMPYIPPDTPVLSAIIAVVPHQRTIMLFLLPLLVMLIAYYINWLILSIAIGAAYFHGPMFLVLLLPPAVLRVVLFVGRNFVQGFREGYAGNAEATNAPEVTRPQPQRPAIPLKPVAPNPLTGRGPRVSSPHEVMAQLSGFKTGPGVRR